MIYELRVIGIPEAAPRPRAFFNKHVGGVRAYTKKTTWSGIFYDHAVKARPAVMLEGPVDLKVEFLFAKPKSARKGDYWKATRPDVDNLVKAILDGLTQAGWWKDDGIVSRCEIVKRFAASIEAPGANVVVRVMTTGAQPELREAV